ncbi:hypothetical protein F5877DRAFT_85282 [Lentinula edodes]|nr:hypothetical protein F5877DRAFT_85282 [Lentinula edodes]
MDGQSAKPIAITIPTEIWLRICELSGERLTPLAEVCTVVRAPAYEYIFKRIEFKTMLDFLDRTQVWIKVGGRVLRLVKELQVGEIGVDVACRGIGQCVPPMHSDGMQIMQDNLAKMNNLTRLTINATTLTSEMMREIAQMENLRGLTLQQVCIIETQEESVKGVLLLEHLRLLDTRWHGPNNENSLIRACKDLQTLQFTWDRSRIRLVESGEKWWNESCQSVKVYSRRSSWSRAGRELDAERQTFVDVNELASFLCERERKESNGHSNQPI